jgi:hypothetical protein
MENNAIKDRMTKVKSFILRTVLDELHI